MLHNYNGTGDIKDNGDTVHALLALSSRGLRTLVLFSHPLDFLLKGLLFENFGGRLVLGAPLTPPLK